MTDIAFTSTAGLIRMLERREIGSLDLVDHFAERQEQYNPDLNAIISSDLDTARKLAREADDARTRGEDHGPLCGLPITVKDAFETAGLVTTGGAAELSDHVPDEDADVVSRLKQAGAIVMGKTNVPLYSGDWQTDNEVFGPTNNPWDLTRTPGGSSGGAAAAIAAGLTGADIGSDIGGSIRIPASFCGLFGHKTSFGLVPMRGHVPPPPGSLTTADLGVAGPIGRSAEDLDLLLGIMAGPAPTEKAWTLSLPEPRFTSIKDLRVAVCADDAFCPVAADVSSAVRETAAALERLGAAVDHEARPDIDFDDLREQHTVLMTAIISSSFPRRIKDWLAAHARTASPDDRSPLALQARGSVLTYLEYLKLTERMAQSHAKWADFFTRFDVLLCPVAPVPAIVHDMQRSVPERTIDVDGKTRPYMDLLPWMTLATPSHLPSTVVPAGTSSGGLPIGTQIIGPLHDDRTTIAVASVLEKEHGGFLSPPPFA